MNPKALLLGATAVAVLASTPVARADSPTDYLGPRELALGGSQRADAMGALATTLNPAGLALNRELVFEGSYGYRFDDGGHIVSVSGCDSTVPIPGCFYYRYFRASPELGGLETRRRVHEVGAALARALTERITFGVNGRYFDHELGPDVDDSGFGVDAGIIVQPVPILRVAAVGYNLITEESSQYPRSIGAGIAIRPILPFGLFADGQWSLDTEEGESTGRYGGGAEYFIGAAGGQTGYPVRVGVLHDVSQDSTYLTGGVGVMSTKLGLDVGVSKQLGGDGFMLQASLRVFGPRQVAGTQYYR